jgi:hypothetical protein
VLGVPGGPHTWPARQTTPHAGQLTLVPSSDPSGHAHWPAWQVSPFAHALPQPPQLLLSELVSVHVLHRVVLPGQEQEQVAVLHCMPFVQSPLLAHWGGACGIGQPLPPPASNPPHVLAQLLVAQAWTALAAVWHDPDESWDAQLLALPPAAQTQLT